MTPSSSPTLLKKNDTDYEVSVKSVSITDDATGITDIASIHNGRPFNVIANLHWEEQIYDVNSTNKLLWEMSVGGIVEEKGVVDLSENRALPVTLNAGQASIEKSGTYNIKVKIRLDTIANENDRDYESFAAGASFVPLVMVLLFTVTTKMVELSLGMGIFTGSCMVAGTLVGGFRTMLDVYLLNALANKDHGYVFLFILFMAGLVGLIEKSGGLKGITHALTGYVKTSRSAQGASFFAGLIIFFDDYANTLVAGASMRPLTDMCFVSREKLAFIVDATAAPIASIVPISSWVGFEISLIQAELDRILEQDPNSEIGNTSAFAVFLQTIKYRYYCIFMLMFIPLLIISGRDFGPMLIAERLTKVYGRTDGGPGGAIAPDGQAIVSHNAPKPDTPCKWWNMAFPIAALIGYIFYLLVWTGQQAAQEAGVEGASFLKLIELSNAYQALLWGTMAAALTGLLFYFVQDKKDGRIIFFNVKGYINKTRRFFDRHRGICCRGQEEGMVDLDGDEEEEEHAMVLIDYREAMASFLIGMEKIFGALVALTLAWATGAIMQAVGLDRFFGEIITNPALDYRMLPTITFIIAILIAFSTGTSWGTMTIMFPLVLVPSYNASEGDPIIFYGVTAGILFAVFLQTIKYRYYCIFMLMFMPLLIISGRDFGPMLIAERLTKVYGRTDGGPGGAIAPDGQAIVSHNAPKPDTPCKWWNMAFPIVALIGYIFYLLVWTGEQAGVGGESFIELIELSNAYQALLWGTMAAALTGLLFYFIQDKKDGRIIFFNVKGYINKTRRFFDRHRGICCRGQEEGMVDLDGDEEEEEHAMVLIDYREAMASFLMAWKRSTGLLFYFIQDKKDGRIIFFNVKGYINKTRRFFDRHRGICRRGQGEEGMVALDGDEHAMVLVDYREAMASFLIGMEKIFGALVALTLAWATGAIMQAVGLDRFFGEIITNPALDYRMLPTLTFIIAVLIGVSTGTSWGTMTIMFPLVLVPSYNASEGDTKIFYGVTAGILAGAVAGDHASPISDTTILASMASECQLLQHVRTQAPYALMAAIWSVLVGTIPSGRGTFPNWVSILLGFLVMLFHVVFTSEFAINKTGRYDIFTELYLRCTKDKEFLTKLKEDTVIAFETGEPVPIPDADKLIEDDDTGPLKDQPKVMSSDNSGPASSGQGLSTTSGTSTKQEQEVMGDIKKQEHAVADDLEKQENDGEVVEHSLEVQALPEEPEIEEHFSGEDKNSQN
eukprot:CAMPEP_0172328688 /NCGR_PEP_ID=MMETSP1058-20130122/60477_1 /TAXON_ID=83371 /ORGANISM="Detonula confervacea, Strain CCMP 353" /LENGTH=1233 /DNA_ID=CAMNT_0013045815 /DNA_START=448 /DNA_END=4149 /DNA_ORIENTATION=-